MESMVLALSTFTLLKSMSLNQKRKNYLYVRENVQYCWTHKEGQYKYYLVTSILKGCIISLFLYKGMSLPIAKTMVDRALEYTFLPPLSLIVGPSLHKDTNAIDG